MDGLWQVDQTVLRAIHVSWHSSLFDVLFFLVSSSGLGFIHVIFALLFLPWRCILGVSPDCPQTTPLQRFSAAYRLQVPLTVPILINFIATGLITSLLKVELPRDRPSRFIFPDGIHVHPQELIYANSFPSGHTSTSVGIALTVLFLTKGSKRAWWGWVAVAWAILVGISRVYRGVHWPTDVLAGACLGLAATALLQLAYPDSFRQRDAALEAPAVKE